MIMGNEQGKNMENDQGQLGQGNPGVGVAAPQEHQMQQEQIPEPHEIQHILPRPQPGPNADAQRMLQQMDLYRAQKDFQNHNQPPKDADNHLWGAYCHRWFVRFPHPKLSTYTEQYWVRWMDRHY